MNTHLLTEDGSDCSVHLSGILDVYSPNVRLADVHLSIRVL